MKKLAESMQNLRNTKKNFLKVDRAAEFYSVLKPRKCACKIC